MPSKNISTSMTLDPTWVSESEGESLALSGSKGLLLHFSHCGEYAWQALGSLPFFPSSAKGFSSLQACKALDALQKARFHHSPQASCRISTQDSAAYLACVLKVYYLHKDLIRFIFSYKEFAYLDVLAWFLPRDYLPKTAAYYLAFITLEDVWCLLKVMVI